MVLSPKLLRNRRAAPTLSFHFGVNLSLTMRTDACRPFAVVIGGAKVADKIGVLWQLIERADVLLIGGRMAFTFLAAQGVAVGRTAIEEGWLDAARKMLLAAHAKVRANAASSELWQYSVTMNLLRSSLGTVGLAGMQQFGTVCSRVALHMRIALI